MAVEPQDGGQGLGDTCARQEARAGPPPQRGDRKARPGRVRGPGGTHRGGNRGPPGRAGLRVPACPAGPGPRCAAAAPGTHLPPAPGAEGRGGGDGRGKAAAGGGRRGSGRSGAAAAPAPAPRGGWHRGRRHRSIPGERCDEIRREGELLLARPGLLCVRAGVGASRTAPPGQPRCGTAGSPSAHPPGLARVGAWGEFLSPGGKKK